MKKIVYALLVSLFCCGVNAQINNGQLDNRPVPQQKSFSGLKNEKLHNMMKSTGLGNLPSENKRWISFAPTKRAWMIDFEKAYNRLNGNQRYIFILGTGGNAQKLRLMNETMSKNNDMYYWVDKYCIKLYIDTINPKTPDDQRAHNIKLMNYIGGAMNDTPVAALLDRNLKIVTVIRDFKGDEYNLIQLLDELDPAYAKTYKKQVEKKQERLDRKEARQEKREKRKDSKRR